MSLNSARNSILERLVALAGKHPSNGELGDLANEARSVLASKEQLFVSVGNDGVYDVSSDDLVDAEVFVIDETRKDGQGKEAVLNAQDGTTYDAHVKRLVVTAPHFDVADVVDGVDGAYANGSRI